MSKPQLEVSTDDMDYLHGELHKLREGTTIVKVTAKALAALLRDHAKLLTITKL
jgi:hypothetical protein